MPSQVKLYFLSIYQATPTVPLSTQTPHQLLHRGRIQTLEPGKNGGATTLIDNAHMPDGIALSTRLGRIFYTQMGTPGLNDGSVYSANLDGSDAKPLLSNGAVNTPKQIILDEVSSKLYFSDREGLRVHRCNIDGSEHEILVKTGDWQNEAHAKDQKLWCVGIAISHRLGKIFWTQKGAPKSGQGRIMSADIEVSRGADATSRRDVEVVASNLPEPIDLEIEEDDGGRVDLYWTDRGEFPFGNTLNRKTLAGNVPESESVLGREILAEGFGEAIGLALDNVNKRIWVADLCGRIWKCDKTRAAAKEKVFESETSVLTGLAMLR